MRYLRKYESFFDVDMAVVEIGKKFSEQIVRDMISNEMIEWSDSYGENGNGEAEDQVITNMISWYEKHSNKTLDESQTDSLEDAIRAHFNIL